MYNDITDSISNATLSQNWRDKNKDTMKYAGDGAKKSIDAGLAEAPDYMRDADEGTSFEDVQTASVKRSLANDSNNSDLAKKATMEVIGHLSAENKEPYLKNAEPLQKYIDTKDEYDYKNNNYTTTQNIDTTPDEKVREVQQKLNEKGYTDKFGEKLKEDGVLGGKTLYAYDTYSATNNRQPESFDNNSNFDVLSLNGIDEDNFYKYGRHLNITVRTGERPGSRETHQNRPLVEKPSNTYVNESGATKWKYLPELVQRLPLETQLFRDKKISKKIFEEMDNISQRWYYANTDKAREEISDLANKVRDNNYQVEDCSNEANDLLYHNGNVIKTFRFVGTAPPTSFKNLFYTIACYAATGLGWYLLVDSGGKWDYKVHIQETEWMPNNGVFWYHDRIVSVADFGNLNYGYTGTILGLSPETLYRGGGKVNPEQTQYEIDNYYGDTEVDHYWIEQGIKQANNAGYYGNLELDVDKIFEILGGFKQ